MIAVVPVLHTAEPRLFAALFVTGFIVAVLDSSIPAFMGRIVTLVTSSAPSTLWAEHWPMLLGMAVVLLVLRPLSLMAQNLVANQAIAVNVSNMIRWQNHWHVARQSWAFFQNDFAGRIANRVMQTGPAVRESLVAPRRIRFGRRGEPAHMIDNDGQAGKSAG